MNKEQIEKYIKEAHESAVEQGFYDCPECEGRGFLIFGNGHHGCENCNQTGINPNRNIGELLMLIVLELSKALEAYRVNRFAPKELNTESYFNCITDKNPDVVKAAVELFKNAFNDTYEDKIANAFIKLFDLCGYLQLKIEYILGLSEKLNENIADNLGIISHRILHIKHGGKDDIETAFATLINFSNAMKIDIQKHIELKMAYNQTRPKKHNKEY